MGSHLPLWHFTGLRRAGGIFMRGSLPSNQSRAPNDQRVCVLHLWSAPDSVVSHKQAPDPVVWFESFGEKSKAGPIAFASYRRQPTPASGRREGGSRQRIASGRKELAASPSRTCTSPERNEKAKPDCKGAPCSLGSPAFSSDVGETRSFPPAPHDAVGVSGTLPITAVLLAHPPSA